MTKEAEKKDLAEALLSHENKTCQGDCAECGGEQRVVRITHPTHDWGFFNYCEAAILEDISRGLTVIPVATDEEGPQI